ncbi:MAG: GIY-YIG nuclease family protein [Patescibacteria group bacterium]
MYYVYIIKSLKNNRHYIGCTLNLEARIRQHNQGKTKSTKPYRPWRLIYSEEFLEKDLAFKREWCLKHPKGYLEKLEIIKKFGEVA